MAHWPSLPHPAPTQPSEDQTGATEELVPLARLATLADQSTQLVVLGSADLEARSAGTELELGAGPELALADQSSHVWLGSVALPR